jgi:hypothetical protein
MEVFHIQEFRRPLNPATLLSTLVLVSVIPTLAVGQDISHPTMLLRFIAISPFSKDTNTLISP